MTYFVMADVSVAFFLLSAMTISLYLIMYMLMYAAAIRLRYSQPDLKRSYRVPGGTIGMWSSPESDLPASCSPSSSVSFRPRSCRWAAPPSMLAWLSAGTVVFTGLPLLIALLRQPSWRAPRTQPEVVVAR